MKDKKGSPVRILVVAGTRPELLKLAPVVQRLREGTAPVATLLCFSGQHTELLDSVLAELGLAPDFDLRAPLEERTLSASLAYLLERLDGVVARVEPSAVVVQGDTSTALAAALVAFHRGVPCFHVEAGLRTVSPLRPFPEEMNRRLVSRLAALHFAPTERARDNLLAEGVSEETVLLTGNTIVDALERFGQAESPEAEGIFDGLRPEARKVLVTLHRRENADRAEDIAIGLRELAGRRTDIDVLWVLHKNTMQTSIEGVLSGAPRVHLIPPLSYPAFLALLRRADFVLTDSGGVQEEAPVFGVPVLVLREETERPEAVEQGVARVVGVDPGAIRAACEELLDDEEVRKSMARAMSPFGDGRASERIVAALKSYFSGP